MVREFEQENELPAQRAVKPVPRLTGAEPSAPGGLAGAVLDVDLSRVHVESDSAEAMTRQIAALTADQRGDQLQRLERSMLRLERINVQTLAMLTKLVEAVKRPELRSEVRPETRLELRSETSKPEGKKP